MEWTTLARLLYEDRYVWLDDQERFVLARQERPWFDDVLELWAELECITWPITICLGQRVRLGVGMAVGFAIGTVVF